MKIVLKLSKEDMQIAIREFLEKRDLPLLGEAILHCEMKNTYQPLELQQPAFKEAVCEIDSEAFLDLFKNDSSDAS